MKKLFPVSHKIAVLFLLLLPLLAGCFSLPDTFPPEDAFVSGIPSPTPSFEEFTMELFCSEVSLDSLSLHYLLAEPSNYGITDRNVTLGSVQTAVSPSESADNLYATLINYNPETLSFEEQLTYRTLMRHLNLLMRDTSSPYLCELLGPVTGFQAQLPILLAEYRMENEQDVEQYLALFPAVYDYFSEIAEFEKEKSRNGFFMDDTTAKEIIRQCEDFCKNPDTHFLISTFEERLSALHLPLSQKTEYIMQHQSALYTYLFPAYELLIDTLTECLGTGENPYGLCYYDGGKDFYSLLIQKTTGSDKSPEDLKKCLANAVDSSYLTMATALKSDSSIYTTALHPAFPETGPEEIIQYIVLQSEEDFPLIDCGNYEFKYVPASLQEHISPAMYLTPPIDRYEPNVIYINPNPVYDPNTLFPTIVHEGYPGHLYQTVSALSGEINPLRYLLTPGGYAEGWATYVEHYCYKYAGLSSPLTSFLQADEVGTLCLYALCDLCIHYEGYTPDRLGTLLAAYGYPRETSDTVYQTLLSEPGTYLPYAVGLLEFLELKETAKNLWGEDYSDYRFHSFLVRTGPLPFSVLNEGLADNESF